MATDDMEYHPITVLSAAIDSMTQYRADLQGEFNKVHPQSYKTVLEHELEQERAGKVKQGLCRLLRNFERSPPLV